MPKKRAHGSAVRPRKAAAKKRPPARPPDAPRSVPTQAERFERVRRQRRRRSRLVRFGVIAALLAVVVGAATFWWNGRRRDQAAIQRVTAGTCRYESDPERGRDHIEGARFAANPPAGGDHAAGAARVGRYTAGDDDLGAIVHAMEHGRAVLWYRPDVGEEAERMLTGVADQYERDVLLVEREGMRTPIAATSWGRRLTCDEAEPDRLAEFVRAFRNRSPERQRE